MGLARTAFLKSDIVPEYFHSGEEARGWRGNRQPRVRVSTLVRQSMAVKCATESHIQI
jgi:hypothetical protein